jgi:hypothetical protein
MFFLVVIFSLIALQRATKKMRSALLIVATVGTLFSLGLSAYELFWLQWTTLPACVYGFFFYVGIFISVWLHRPATPMTTTTA